MRWGAALYHETVSLRSGYQGGISDQFSISLSENLFWKQLKRLVQNRCLVHTNRLSKTTLRGTVPALIYLLSQSPLQRRSGSSQMEKLKHKKFK